MTLAKEARLALVVALVLVAQGCGDDDDDAVVDGGATDGAAGDGATASGRTLTSCVTNIESTVPKFYRDHFKCVTITGGATSVTIQTESLPPHKSYYYGSGHVDFAPFDTSRGAMYMPNPNRLVSRTSRVTIPGTPQNRGIVVTSAMVDGMVGTDSNEYPLGPVGVALDSVALFNPLARPGDDIENEKYTFDDYNAHPAPDGTYHYHTTSKGPLEVMVAIGASTSATPGGGGTEVLGIMCDGTIVFGCTELDGSAPQLRQDAQGGHAHDIVEPGGAVAFPGRYHTHVCPSASGGRKYTPEIQFYSTCTR